MIREREMDRILGDWAREGVDALPDRLIDAVLGDIERTPQRRHVWFPASLSSGRPWLRLVLVAAALLALAGAVALIAGNVTEPQARPFPGDGERVEPGRHVLDAPFEFHLSIDVPDGWLGVELAGGWSAIARDEEGAVKPELAFTTVRALPVDPCRPELGLQESLLGPGGQDLVDGLARVPAIGPGLFQRTTLGGQPAMLLTLTGGQAGLACASTNAFTLWTVGQPYSLETGMRHRIWIVEVDGRRLVVAARDFGPETRAAHDLDAIVSSILLGRDAPPWPSQPPESAVPDDEAPIPSIPPSGVIKARDNGYVVPFTVYAYGVDRFARQVDGQHDWVLPVVGDWTRTSHGMARQGNPGGGASLSIWSVRRVYVDPCHWDSSSLVLLGPQNVDHFEALARTLSAWWGPDPDEAWAGEGYVAPAFSPTAGSPVLQGWPGTWARHFDLDVPGDLDLASCDGGEYRIWEDHDGTARSAQPGERISLRVSQLAGGVVVLESGLLNGSNERLRADLRDMLDWSYIGPY